MGYRWLGSVAWVAACYQPSASPGAPCSPTGECPSGLECRDNVCVLPGSSLLDAPAPQGDAVIDSSSVFTDAPVDGQTVLGPWGMPTKITSLDIPGTQSDPTFTADRLTVVMSTDTGSGTLDDLWYCTRSSLTAAFACNLMTTVSSSSTDKSPEISPDGSVLYFTSSRSGSLQVYKTTQSGGVWSMPAVQTDLSTAGADSDVAISPDGLTAVVYVDDVQNHFIISTRTSTAQAFSNPVTHTELEFTTDIASPWISNGGAIMYLHAGAVRDLYVTTRKADGTYTTPAPITELDTASRDAAPCVSADNRYMMFDRASTIYETSR